MFVSMFVLSPAIVYTGARAAFLTSMIGLSVYLVPVLEAPMENVHCYRRRHRYSGLGLYSCQHSRFLRALAAVFRRGQQSGRDIIFAEALDMISERPLLGWQPVQFKYELGSRTASEIWHKGCP